MIEVGVGRCIVEHGVVGEAVAAGGRCGRRGLRTTGGGRGHAVADIGAGGVRRRARARRAGLTLVRGIGAAAGGAAEHRTGKLVAVDADVGESAGRAVIADLITAGAVGVGRQDVAGRTGTGIDIGARRVGAGCSCAADAAVIIGARALDIEALPAGPGAAAEDCGVKHVAAAGRRRARRRQVGGDAVCGAVGGRARRHGGAHAGGGGAGGSLEVIERLPGAVGKFGFLDCGLNTGDAAIGVERAGARADVLCDDRARGNELEVERDCQIGAQRAEIGIDTHGAVGVRHAVGGAQRDQRIAAGGGDGGDLRHDILDIVRDVDDIAGGKAAGAVGVGGSHVEGRRRLFVCQRAGVVIVGRRAGSVGVVRARRVVAIAEPGHRRRGGGRTGIDTVEAEDVPQDLIAAGSEAGVGGRFVPGVGRADHGTQKSKAAEIGLWRRPSRVRVAGLHCADRALVDARADRLALLADVGGVVAVTRGVRIAVAHGRGVDRRDRMVGAQRNRTAGVADAGTGRTRRRDRVGTDVTAAETGGRRGCAVGSVARGEASVLQVEETLPAHPFLIEVAAAVARRRGRRKDGRWRQALRRHAVGGIDLRRQAGRIGVRRQRRVVARVVAAVVGTVVVGRAESYAAAGAGDRLHMAAETVEAGRAQPQ